MPNGNLSLAPGITKSQSVLIGSSIIKTEQQKMLAGELFTPLDPPLVRESYQAWELLCGFGKLNYCGSR